MDTILFKTFIRNSVSLQEAQYRRIDLIDDDKSNAMQDYINFLIELEDVINGD